MVTQLIGNFGELDTPFMTSPHGYGVAIHSTEYAKEVTLVFSDGSKQVL